MSAPVISDAALHEADYHRLEQVAHEAAEAERAAFLAWQDAYGAYEVARDDASAAWTAWARDTVS
ncbi:MAG TPA: hypothetical protein VFO16_23390 [Pseudonocardiaceae bacterium]|nr:hypothetical protein [Pseudonocardiaceae bacterium]